MLVSPNTHNSFSVDNDDEDDKTHEIRESQETTSPDNRKQQHPPKRPSSNKVTMTAMATKTAQRLQQLLRHPNLPPIPNHCRRKCPIRNQPPPPDNHKKCHPTTTKKKSIPIGYKTFHQDGSD
jgi:hypothetical protein